MLRFLFSGHCAIFTFFALSDYSITQKGKTQNTDTGRRATGGLFCCSANLITALTYTEKGRDHEVKTHMEGGENMIIHEETNFDVPLEIIRASEVEPKEVKWLWYPYIPFGKVTILQGDPGDGKSALALKVASILTKGDPLPFTDEEPKEPVTVIYQTTEDDLDDTVVPRFLSSDGNAERLIFIKENEKRLTFGDPRLIEAIRKYDAKVLILDPLSAYIGENCSMNMANETRAEFNHLIETAKATDCAVLIVAHMNKMRSTEPLYRTVGSIDVVGAARSVLSVVRTNNKENPNERLLVQVKSNLSSTGSAIVFEVSEDGVNFIDEIEMTAKEAFELSGHKMGRPSEKCDEAKRFIEKFLGDGKPHPASECIQKLKAAGFKESTFKKAKRKLGVVTDKPSFGFTWQLPKVEEGKYQWEEITADDDLPFGI